MKHNRRKFLSILAASAFAGSAFAGKFSANSHDIDAHAIITGLDELNKLALSNKPILPPALKSGDTIAITAPASPTSYWEMRKSIKALKKLGYKIEVGDTITKRKSKYRYLSAPDEVRATEFMEYVERPDVKCILCGRGGYGVSRILPLLDFNAIRNNPKIIIGFSDITALLNAVYFISGVVSFHGPVAASTFNQFTINYFQKILAPNPEFLPIVIKYSTIKTINPGTACGKLIGGNLSMLAGTLGTPYEIDTRDSILFIEEVSEHPYKIDRMLTQLWLAGKLQACKGIIFGYFKGLNSRRSFYPGGSFTIKQVIDNRIKPLGIPAVLGMPIGHVKSKLTLPIGINAELNSSDKTLTILETSVEI